MRLENAYEMLYVAALIFMGLVIFTALIRCVRGPETADRILAVNMIGTAVTMAILVLSLLLEQSYLGDVALIYVLINFISVAIIATVYIPKRKSRRKEDTANDR